MKRKIQWLAIGILWAAALLFNLAARSFGGFAEWYASAIYPVWVNTIGRLLSPLPFSAVEFLLYGGILLVLYWLARGIVRLAKGKRDAGEVLLSTTIYLWLISLTASKELPILLLKLYNDGAIGISASFPGPSVRSAD